MKTKPIRLPLNKITLLHIAIRCRTPYSLHRFIRAEIKNITEAWHCVLIERHEALFALDEIRGMLPCSRK